MKLLALIHPALAEQPSEDPPDPTKPERFKLQAPELPSLRRRTVQKGLLFVAAIASVLSIAPNALAELQFGNNGSEVRALQSALGISADGFFGSQTERAVIRYQRICGLRADGIAGNTTLASLASGACLADGLAEDGLADGGFRPLYSDYSEPDYSEPDNSGQGRPILPDSVGGPYVVVVPGTQLVEVQRFVPDAFLADASGNRDEFVNAGGYSTRSEAQRISNRLQDNGLPARVDFRP